MTSKRKKIDIKSQKKLRGVFCVLFILLIVLTIKLGYIQFIQGPDLKKEAIHNQLSNKTLVPKRGTIYDSTGKGLALSARVDTISVNPSKIEYDDNQNVNKEILAHAFSNIFEIDYNETLEKLNSHDSNFVIAKKVENDKVTKLKEWMEENKINSGITIQEDIKRYYPYDNLASNLIGFTGTDNYGLAGLEATLNNELARNTRENFSFNKFNK